MSLWTPTAAEAVSALVALAVVVGAVTVGGAVQTDSQANSTSSDDEPNDSLANATRVEYGEERDANLSSPSDVDYYAVNATAGDATIPRLRLKNMFEGSAIQVDVVTPSGEVTTELANDVSSGPQNVAGTEDVSPTDTAYTGNVMEFNGTYYVRVKEATNLPVGGSKTNRSDTYRYNLTVNTTSLDEYDPNENGTTATPIELGQTTNATFAGYDSDVYAVNLTANQTYSVRVESSLEGPTKQLWVYDDQSQPVDDPDRHPNGTTVATTSYSFLEPTTVTFTASENGTYYVQMVEGIENYDLLGRSSDGDLIGPLPYEITANRTDWTPSADLPDDGDADSDGLTNEEEGELGTDPEDADTDGDGLSDGCELRNDTDPTGPDTDDGAPDGEEA